MATITGQKLRCFHCGEACTTDGIHIGNKPFCCEGCKMVYQLLDGKGLCNYYDLNEKPGINQRIPVRKDKFAFLDDEKISSGLIAFRNDTEVHVNLYLPQIHCSSCLYLLEHLHRMNGAVLSSHVDFAAREITVIFDPAQLSLRQLAELLTSIGYEPYISLRDLVLSPPAAPKTMIYQLGVAGFCFANIMLLSFPEYLGLDKSEPVFQHVFRILDLALSLPVLLYCAQPFYLSAWKGLRHNFLNIDAPIALAILVTFFRSAVDVLSGTGAGYFDSMTGIVFFMLAGRMLQNRTYRQLSFDRDYKSYFPIAVTVLNKDKGSGQERELTRMLPDIRCGDELLIHHGDIIPADGIITRGEGLVDYSFVTGESITVPKGIGEIVYAGGRQTGAALEILVVKEVAQSYLTQLWNRQGHNKEQVTNPASSGLPGEKNSSFVDLLSRYFTYIVLTIAAMAAIFWQVHDPARTWGAVTSVLIIACPCALLLSSTFTNGNILRILGRHHFYLRNAGVIDSIAATTHIVFDKTGTLTDTGQQELVYEGIPLSPEDRQSIATLAAQSSHPLSRKLTVLSDAPRHLPLTGYREIKGKGIEGFVDGESIAIGSLAFVRGKEEEGAEPPGTRVYVRKAGIILGYFTVTHHYRKGTAGLMQKLRPRFKLSLLSGDNGWERPGLQALLGKEANLLFGQLPKNKARYILKLQRTGDKVMMVGDGLNDAGALRRSDTGIALSENCNSFTPASDAILDSAKLTLLPKFIHLCQANRTIILASFMLSVLYNIIGLSFAVQGTLSPLIAAILMPASSLSILLVTYGSSNIVARVLKLT